MKRQFFLIFLNLEHKTLNHKNFANPLRLLDVVLKHTFIGKRIESDPF